MKKNKPRWKNIDMWERLARRSDFKISKELTESLRRFDRWLKSLKHIPFLYCDL